MTESKEKKLKGWYKFLYGQQHVIWEKKKKKIVNGCQTIPHYYTHSIQGGKMMQHKLDSIIVVSRTHHLKIAEWLMRARQASTTLFLCAQNWKCPYDKATITKNPYETTTKPFKSRLKNLNGKGNGVIQLLIKLYIKMPLRLNSNNKKTIRK